MSEPVAEKNQSAPAGLSSFSHRQKEGPARSPPPDALHWRSQHDRELTANAAAPAGVERERHHHQARSLQASRERCPSLSFPFKRKPGPQ
eukprot:1161803-Pelagomonas_calceolata.AAC.12